MQWTDRIRQTKILLVVAAVLIAVASLVASNLLTRDLYEEEHKKMEIWAEAMRTLNVDDGNDGMNLAGRRAYSSYVEASVPFAFGGIDWTATAGVVPFATDFYGVDRIALTNLSLTAAKDIEVTERFSIPVFAQVMLNPTTRDAFFVVGITLQP